MGCAQSTATKPGGLAESDDLLFLDPDDQCVMCMETAGEDAADENVEAVHLLKDEVGDGSSVMVVQSDKICPWIRPDCKHACHLECLRQRVEACSRPRPTEKLTFAHLTCATCRVDMKSSDPAQTRGAKSLEALLGEHFRLRSEVITAQRKHAREDPVDRIPGLDKMEPTEAESLIHRRIGAFRCSQCNSIFCEGIVCAGAADDTSEGPPGEATKMCQRCTIHKNAKLGGKLRKIDFSKCKEPLYKCDLCCSLAVYRCADYYQCEKHHGQGSKTVEKCPGESKCPLACAHPQNERKKCGFIIGCGCGKCA